LQNPFAECFNFFVAKEGTIGYSLLTEVCAISLPTLRTSALFYRSLNKFDNTKMLRGGIPTCATKASQDWVRKSMQVTVESRARHSLQVLHGHMCL